MNVKHALAWLLCACTSLALASQAQAQSVSCSGIPEWNAAAIYAAGAKLTYQSKLYQTTTQIWNVAPTYCTSCGWYQELGTCSASGGNQPPTVALTAPVAGTTFNAGATITLTASASDSDGTIAGVEFFNGSTSLGSDASAPYSVSWSGVGAGNYVLSAKATDNAGATTTSATSAITVNAVANDTTAPSVPTGLAATAQTSASITLTWNASTDNSGGSGVAGYQVYRNGSLAGSPAGTSFTDSALLADTAYTYTVRARDNAGNVSANSAQVSARTTAGSGGGGTRRVIGYFTQWGIYGRNYQVRDIEASGAAGYLTHINYAFGNVRNNRCEVGLTIPSNESTGEGGDAFADYSKSFAAGQSVDGIGDTWDQPLRGNWNQLKKLKAKHPGLKVLISLGGWTWSRGFASAARPENRQAFVASCVDAYIRGNLPVTDGAGGTAAAAGVFDGIDIDWEYPAACGLACGTAEERQRTTPRCWPSSAASWMQCGLACC